MNVSIKRIPLSGAAAGSAVITERNGKSFVSLSVQSLPRTASVFCAGASGITRAGLVNSSAEVGDTSVCAVAVCDGARLILYGFTGECRKNRGRLLSEIRIRAAQKELKSGRDSEEHADKDAASPPSKTPAPNNAPNVKRAAATEEILKQAEKLFSVLYGINGSPDETRGASINNEAHSDKPSPASGQDGLTVIKNPFPRTYPNAVWQKKPGDGRLFGSLPSGKRLIAVPSGGRVGIKNAVRTVISSDGRRYLIVDY